MFCYSKKERYLKESLLSRIAVLRARSDNAECEGQREGFCMGTIQNNNIFVRKFACKFQTRSRTSQKNRMYKREKTKRSVRDSLLNQLRFNKKKN